MRLEEFERKRKIYCEMKSLAIIVGILGTVYMIVSIGAVIEKEMELAPGMAQAGIGAGTILVAYILNKIACRLDKQIIQKRFRELWDKK